MVRQHEGCNGTREDCPYRDEIRESMGFQKQSIAILTRLETKMNIIIGEDGNSGRLGVLETRVASLEETRSEGRGFFFAGKGLFIILGTLWTAVLAYVDYLLHKH